MDGIVHYNKYGGCGCGWILMDGILIQVIFCPLHPYIKEPKDG